MEELKPRLILTKSNKSRFDFGKYIFFLIIFMGGFYFGYSYKSLDPDILLDSKNQITKITEIRINNLDLDQSSKPRTLNPGIEEKKNIKENKISNENRDENDLVLVKNVKKGEIQEVSDKANTRKNIIVIDNKVKDYKDESVIDESVIKDLISDKQIQNYEKIDGLSSEDNSSYTLQIAAFETERKSNEVVEELSNKGYKVYSISVINSQGDRWNLVKLGNFATLLEAQKFSELLLSSEGINSNIEVLEKPKVTTSNKYY